MGLVNAWYVETLAGKIGAKVYDALKVLRAASFLWQGVSPTAEGEIPEQYPNLSDSEALLLGESAATPLLRNKFEVGVLVLATSVDGRSKHYDIAISSDAHRASCQIMAEMMYRRLQAVGLALDARSGTGLSTGAFPRVVASSLTSSDNCDNRTALSYLQFLSRLEFTNVDAKILNTPRSPEDSDLPPTIVSLLLQEQAEAESDLWIQEGSGQAVRKLL